MRQADFRFTHNGAAFLKVLITVLLTANLYGLILLGLAHDWWTQPAHSQGMLLLPLALYMAWNGRRDIFAQPIAPSRFGYAVSGLAGVVLLAGTLAAEYFLARISFVVLLVGFTLTFWGKRRLQALTLPFLLLVAMVPLPLLVYATFAAPLQLLASNASAGIARMFGVAVFQDGNLIHLAGLTLGIAEACSGLNSISALMVASLLFGSAFRLSAWFQTILFVLSIPVSVAVNVLRVAGSAILADYDTRLATGFYHYFSGWLVFVLGSLALICLGRTLRAFSPRVAG